MSVKKARGTMLNLMILNEITSLDDLKTLNADGYVYNEQMSQDYNIVFVKES